MQINCTTCGVWEKCMEEDYEENPTRPLCCRCQVTEGLLTTESMCEDCQREAIENKKQI